MTNTSDIAPIGLLTGKVVFITGASRGIGAAAARLFAREGAAVVLAARSTDALERIVKEIRADGGVADAFTLDLAGPASIRAALRRVEEEVLRDHVAHCVEHAIATGNKADQRQKITELMEVIGRADR